MSTSYQIPRLRGAGIVLAMLLLVGALASPASAESFVNRWTQVQIGVANGAPVAVAGAPAADWVLEDAGGGFVRLKNAATGAYLNVEKGLAVGPVGPGWWSAQWTLEQAGGFVRIKNRWTGVYLNVEKGPLAATPAQPGWWSAQWQVAAARGQGAPAALKSGPELKTAATPEAQPEAQPDVQETDQSPLQKKCYFIGQGLDTPATEEQACTCRLMSPQGGQQVRWGPSATWTEARAQALCAGTPKADLPIGCFQAALALGANWQQAIPWCAYDFSSCDYSNFDSNGGNWTKAVAQCHFGGEAETPDVKLLKAGTKCTSEAVAIYDPKTKKNVDQDQATTVCDRRDAVVFPADCLKTAVGVSVGLSIDQGVTLCRNTLSNVMTMQCYGLGKAAGASTQQVIEVCRMQDEHLSGVTQQASTYGMGMRDSCVRRKLGLDQGKTDFAAGWKACKGQILY